MAIDYYTTSLGFHYHTTCGTAAKSSDSLTAALARAPNPYLLHTTDSSEFARSSRVKVRIRQATMITDATRDSPTTRTGAQKH